MPLYPRLHTQLTEQEMIDGFGGYDHRLRIADGAWFDTENLSSDLAPMLSVRRPRGNTHLRAAALLEKDALAYVSEDGTLYYNFLPTAVTGLSAAPKQIVGMGAYLVIFPDKVYFNTADQTDRGSLEAHFAPQSAGYELCRFDGTALRADYIQPDEPDAPQNAQYWIDTSGESNVLRQWSGAQGDWVTVETAYVRIGFETRGVVPKLFSAGDGVTVSGSSLGEVNGEKLLAAVGGGGEESDWVILTALPAHLPDDPDTALRIDRSVPEPDFVCECQNRLWGCRYGLGEDGRPVNEIFCCALGDFKNWKQFRGLATDSWVGSVGSDGQLSRLAHLFQGKPHPPRGRLPRGGAHDQRDRLPRRAEGQRKIAARSKRDAVLQIPLRRLRVPGRLPRRRVRGTRREKLSRRGRRRGAGKILSFDA